MTSACIQIFVEKLNHLINCNNYPLFNDRAIKRERPQLQLLYEELGSMIQTLFIDQHQDLEKVSDLKKRFKDASEEAEYIVDLFLSGVHIRNTIHFPYLHDVSRSIKSVVNRFLLCVHVRNNGYFLTPENFKRSLNLDDVRRSFKSIEVEFMSMNIHRIDMDSSGRPQRTLNQSAATAQSSTSRNSLGLKKLSDEIFVGIDRDAELIRDKLVEDQKKLDVVSIVGMGGIGKTTLATKVFNDGYVKHHFHVRVWVTVSQTYDKRDVLIQILESICHQLCLEKVSDSRLREMVHKHLICKRYLIVIDDIWHIETWDNLKVFFPHDNTGSRILLTSRLIEVAKHANPDGLIHHLGYLNKEKSWELLCQKVFHGNECPKWSIKPGMQIVENCQGLPLAVVVIAGVLAKDVWSKELWVEIAYKAGSKYIAAEHNGYLETLGLSYTHLPFHLRECFLYLGGFPEDYMFKVRELIWLWVAEGFIQQDGSRSLEDIAEGYLMDLIDKNLVIVVDRRNCDGTVNACKVHDLVRELCLQKAKEEQFILQTERLLFSHTNNVITTPYKPVRMFINEDINIPKYPYPSAQNLRAIFCFPNFRCSVQYVVNYLCSFLLLRVLDLRKCELDDLPKGMELLVHLRYLAVYPIKAFPSAICNLWNLQTLIYITYDKRTILPSDISNLVNLRHLWSFKKRFFLPSIEKPMSLQTISNVMLGDDVDNFQKCFPYIKELTCTTYIRKQNDFKSLQYLEKLKVTSFYGRMDHIIFPRALKTLTLVGFCLPWSDMSIIRSLPNLQLLKLKRNSFKGSCWSTNEQEFRKLRFLRLEMLDIKLWEAFSPSFPCLGQLEIKWCEDLVEIPLEIGDIPTLELIKIEECRPSVGESVRRIEEEQHDLGNFDLKIDITEY